MLRIGLHRRTKASGQRTLYSRSATWRTCRLAAVQHAAYRPCESPRQMQHLVWSVAVLAAVSCARPNIARAAPAPAMSAVVKPADARPGDANPDELKAEEKTSRGQVTIGGRRIDYSAVAGTLVVHPKDAERSEEHT